MRTQGGAGWSPGAQHAQQLEAWFVHVPGLKVVFASTPSDVRGLLWSSIYDDNTVIFFEHRTLYPIKEEVPEELEPIPLGQARVHREGEDVTVIATGRLVHESLRGGGARRRRRASRSRSSTRARSSRSTRRRSSSSVKKTNRCVVAHEAVVRGGLRRRGRRGRPVPGVRLARRADRAGRVEVHADPVRAGDGELRRPARRRRARRDPQDGGAQWLSEVTLPRLGQGMESGTIVRWLKSEGDAVEKGEPLYELDTDKVTQEVEADVGGVLLKILVPEGEVPVGTAVGVIGEEGESVPEVEAEAGARAGSRAGARCAGAGAGSADGSPWCP